MNTVLTTVITFAPLHSFDVAIRLGTYNMLEAHCPGPRQQLGTGAPDTDLVPVPQDQTIRRRPERLSDSVTTSVIQMCRCTEIVFPRCANLTTWVATRFFIGEPADGALTRSLYERLFTFYHQHHSIYTDGQMA